MELSTPGILFAAISLLLLAYSDRFSEIAKLIRQLIIKEEHCTIDIVEQQLTTLKKRLFLIKLTQLFGVLSYLLCGASLFALLLKDCISGKVLFTASVICLLLTLLSGFWEVLVSTKALDIILNNHYKKLKDEKKNC